MTLVQQAPLHAARSLRGAIRVPSDKSIAHRALICAALAHGESRISLREPGADVLSTIRALTALGVHAEAKTVGEGIVLRVAGQGNARAIGRLGAGTADCGNSGTTMRLLAGALASGTGSATLIGDKSLSGRPMARVAQPLRSMGADIQLTGGHAPLTVTGHRPLRALDHVLSVASAQVLGAISLAALAADGTTTVRVPGHVRDHTERMLRAMGAEVSRSTEAHGSTTTIAGPAALRALDVVVPTDFSSASAWIVAAALHPDAQLRLADVALNPTRTALLDVLRGMGADITQLPTGTGGGEPVGDVVVRGGRPLRAFELDADEAAPLIDELPLLAVAMAAAQGTSEVRGASELRVKESDRIAAMAAALTAAGARVEELPDGWRIAPGRPLDAHVATHGDHRVAIAMAVAAWSGVAASVVLDDQACVGVSYPSFWDDARSIGAMS